MLRRIKLVFLFAIVLASSAQAAPQCLLQPDKRELVTKLICGQYAPEQHYRHVGPGCFERSLRARANDSAVHVSLYALCGEASLSERIRAANEQTFAMMQKLSVCAGEVADGAAIFRASLEAVRKKLSNESCGPKHRELVATRRTHFLTMANSIESGAAETGLFGKLGIMIGADGSVLELKR